MGFHVFLLSSRMISRLCFGRVLAVVRGSSFPFADFWIGSSCCFPVGFLTSCPCAWPIVPLYRWPVFCGLACSGLGGALFPLCWGLFCDPRTMFVGHTACFFVCLSSSCRSSAFFTRFRLPFCSRLVSAFFGRSGCGFIRLLYVRLSGQRGALWRRPILILDISFRGVYKFSSFSWCCPLPYAWFVFCWAAFPCFAWG